MFPAIIVITTMLQLPKIFKKISVTDESNSLESQIKQSWYCKLCLNSSLLFAQLNETEFMTLCMN